MTVTAASLSENAVGIQLLDQAKKTYPTISKSWVEVSCFTPKISEKEFAPYFPF